jgi:hypothetical protein
MKRLLVSMFLIGVTVSGCSMEGPTYGPPMQFFNEQGCAFSVERAVLYRTGSPDFDATDPSKWDGNSSPWYDARITRDAIHDKPTCSIKPHTNGSN